MSQYCIRLTLIHICSMYMCGELWMVNLFFRKIVHLPGKWTRHQIPVASSWTPAMKKVIASCDLIWSIQIKIGFFWIEIVWSINFQKNSFSIYVKVNTKVYLGDTKLGLAADLLAILKIILYNFWPSFLYQYILLFYFNSTGKEMSKQFPGEKENTKEVIKV